MGHISAMDTLVDMGAAEAECVCGSCPACERDTLRIRAETAERLIEMMQIQHARDIARACEEVRRHRDRADVAEAELARLRHATV